jgi:hypothetical protein
MERREAILAGISRKQQIKMKIGKWIEIVDELPRREGESYKDYKNREAGREGLAMLIGVIIGVIVLLVCLML